MPDNLTGWIFGVGPIGQEYAKILSHHGITYQAIGLGEKGATAFTEVMGHDAISGGIVEFLKTSPQKPDFAIVAVTTTNLADVTAQLLNYGVRRILLEKPGGMHLTDLESLSQITNHAEVYIAYNRRFLASTQKAVSIIKEDGGALSFHFDFTEWPSRILSYEHAEGTLERWFYLNSTHVIDLAFFIGGWPSTIESTQSGNLEWHSPSIFSGCGKSVNGSVFSYKANWESAGRWLVEIMTSKRKLILSPLEHLKEQRLNERDIRDIPLDNKSDELFKPGFFVQTTAFLNGDIKNLLSLQEQINHWKIFDKISGRA